LKFILTKKKPSTKYYNLLTIDKNYKIKIIEKESNTILYDEILQIKYIKWLNNYIKYYLLANLTNDEFVEYFYEKENKRISCKEDIAFFVNKLTFKQIIKKIKDVL